MSIVVDNLAVSYRSRLAVHYVSAGLADQSMWAVFGPNGAEESVLLKVVMGLQKADISCVHQIELKHGDIAYLLQQSETNRSQPVTAFELVAMGLQYETGFFGHVSAGQRQHVFDALERVEMADFAEQRVVHLPNGQFQCVLFVQAPVQDTKFLPSDESFNAADVKTTYVLLEVLATCHTEGRMVIAVLHDYEQVHAYFADMLSLAREEITAGATEAVLTEEHLRQTDAAMQRHGSAG